MEPSPRRPPEPAVTPDALGTALQAAGLPPASGRALRALGNLVVIKGGQAGAGRALERDSGEFFRGQYWNLLQRPRKWKMTIQLGDDPSAGSG